MVEVAQSRQSYRLKHFSIGEGSNMLRQRLRDAKESGVDLREPPAPAARPWSVQFEVADRVINYAITTAFPKRRNTADLLNETALLEPNVDRALGIIESNGTVNDRLKFEVVRKLLLAGISGDLDESSRNFQLRNELHDVHDLLDRELFAGKTGQTWPTTTYSIHRNKTNQAIWVGDVHPLIVGPGRHVKKFQQQMRYVEDVGYILSSVREKSRESSIVKALRRAVQKSKASQSDHIDTFGEVLLKDAMGLQFVVKGTMSSNEPRVNVLKEKVLATMRKKYGEVILEKADKVPGKSDDAIQSPSLGYQRLLVRVADFPMPIELMFFGEGDYINNKYETGRKNRREKTYDGQAHALYEIKRVAQILPVLYPEQLNGEPILGYMGLADETKRTNREKAKSLRRSNKIRWQDAPSERWTGLKIRVRQNLRRDQKHYERVY